MTRFQSQRKQKNTMNLSTKQKQHLKGLAHPLKPVVMLGNNGLTEGVLAEIEQALGHHELIKVKIASEDRETKALIVEAIVRETGACNVQVIGKTLVLYAQRQSVKSRCHAKNILNLDTTLCKTRGISAAGLSKMPCSDVDKKRYAAFFLSLQSINIVAGNTLTGIQPW